MATPFLAVCGHTNLDVHLQVADLPRENQSTPVLERRTLWGGTAANVARHAGGLGLANRLWSRVGDDFPAAWRKALEHDHVDLAFMDVVDGAATPTCFILTDSLERQSFCMDQGPMSDMAQNPPPQAMLDGLHPDGWLHLATGDPFAYAALADAARRAGLQVALDPGQELRYKYDARSLEGMLRVVDLFWCNQAEAAVACNLLGLAGPEALLDYVDAVIMTRSAKGATLLRRNHAKLEQEAFAAKVVDPTGAGDACRAGFYAGLQAGKDWPQALRWGQAAASVNVGWIGGQSRAVSQKDIASRLA